MFLVFKGKMAMVTDATRSLLSCLRAAGCLHSTQGRSQDLGGPILHRSLSAAVLFSLGLRGRAPPPRLWCHIDSLSVSLDTRWPWLFPWEGTAEQQGPSCLSESVCSLGLSGPRQRKDQCSSRTLSVLLLSVINSGEGEE